MAAPLAKDLQLKGKELRQTDTTVTYKDGSQVVETRPATGADAAITVKTNKRTMGFVADYGVDLKLGNPMKGLYIGSCDAAANREVLQTNGITHILNVAIDLENRFAADTSLTYKSLPIFDMPEQDIEQYFDITNKFIDDSLASGKGAVLVHCMAGVSRSATIVAAYLMKETVMTAEQAVAKVRETRWVMPNAGFLKQLKSYYNTLHPA